MKKLLITTKLADKGVEVLKKHFDVQVIPKIPKQELLKIIPKIEILLVRSETTVDKEILDAAKNLKIIGRAGVGLDNIDKQEAEKQGIQVLNTPHGNSIAVAELVFGIALTLLRNIREADQSIKQDKWIKPELVGGELHGKTFAIVGLGKIGQITAKIAHGFGMQVTGFDPFFPKEEFKKLNVKRAETLEELLTAADIITFHIPKTPETTDLIGEKELKLMKKTAILINCARGGIINEKELLNALQNKEIAAAGIDTWTSEPEPNKKLKKLKNVLALPHLGASTREAQERCIFDLINPILKNYGY